jgi:hypothetical protein
MQKPFLIFIALFICYTNIIEVKAQCGTRYYDKIFAADTTNAVKFGRNAKFNGDTIDLRMDIFQPQGDTLSKRPMIILAFGGSFTSGIRQSPDIVRLCNEFSQRGYVCVTIDYRLGFENNSDSDTNQLKAVFRGVQDMRAAIRYFYKDASTANHYRIDTNQIFCGGVSAGGFISLNHAYFKLGVGSRPVPPWAADALIEIGGVDGFSGNEGYSSIVKGVINLCGAIADTLWIQPQDPIIVSVHGTDDDLVPIFYDSTQAAQSVEAMFYGSGDIHNRATHVGISNHLKIFYGAEHVPFIFPSHGNLNSIARYMDTTIWTIRDFLYQNLDCNNTSVSEKNDESKVNIYPNPVTGILNIETDKSYSALEVSLFDIQGKQLEKHSFEYESKFQLSFHNRTSGLYIIELKDEKNGNIISRKKLMVD